MLPTTQARHGASRTTARGVGLWCFVVAWLGACSEEQIVVASVPTATASSGVGSQDASVPTASANSGDESQDEPDKALRCTSNSDCEGTDRKMYCAFKRCGDSAGVCEFIPAGCSDQLAPVCGCDGVTYWNNCFRRAAAVSADTKGECIERPRKCVVGKPPVSVDGSVPSGKSSSITDNGETCPSGTFCARLVVGPLVNDPDAACREDTKGICWAVPAVCPDRVAEADGWLACGASGDAKCVTTCEAIRSEKIHLRALQCR